MAGERPEESERPVTVREALRMPPLRRGRPRVVAGNGQLENAIRWVHSSDVENIAELLRGGELLLTTGAGIGRGREQQRRYVRRLAELGVAGVVVELGTAWSKLPVALVQEAEERGLPLVALGDEVPFVAVTEGVHARILDRLALVQRRADDFQRTATTRLIDGAGVAEILAMLADAVANPVVLAPSDGRQIHHAGHHADGAEVTAAWRLVDVEAPGPSDAVVVAVPGPGRGVWGHLAVLALDSELSDFARAVSERAVTPIALALSRIDEERTLGSRERGNFLAEVADDRVDAADLEQRAAELGFAPGGRPILPVVALLQRTAPSRAGQPTAAVWRAVGNALRVEGVSLLHGFRAEQGDAVMLLALSRDERREPTMDVLASTLRAAIVDAAGTTEHLVLAAGPAVRRWSEVGAGIRRAAITAEHAREMPERGWHDATQADVARLLWSLREDAQLTEFVDQRIGPVLDHDTRRAAKLLPTLEALCAHQWRKSETARALHLERQSLYPRLLRIERLLRCDLDDPDTRLGLELAVRARQLAEGRP